MTSSSSSFPIFDAHLDLAYLAVNKRRMDLPLDPLAGPHPPSAVTLDSLAKGNVRFALATIFTEPVDSASAANAPEKYHVQTTPDGLFTDTSIASAYHAGRAQLEAYLTWRDQNAIALNLRSLFHTDPDIGEIRGGMGVIQHIPPTPEQLIRRSLSHPSSPLLHAGILIENADPIRSPDELAWWVQRGVVAVGMAWTKPSRYAGGNATTLGISPLGRQLIREMDRLKVIHDASHLSDRAFDDLFDLAQGPIIASHSNCRSLLAASPADRQALQATVPGIPLDIILQRHLSDDQIHRIVNRRSSTSSGGVIGLNLYSKFLDPVAAASGRASIQSCIRHINHICDIAGDRKHVALGTDMDGGFSADRLPLDIDTPAHLSRLFDALADTGWNDEDILGFACCNWARVLTESFS